MLARIVVGRSLDQPDQQREFTDVELAERLGEVEFAAESETVYRARAVLAEIHFVQVRDQNVLFGEMRLEPHSHHGLGCFSTDGLFVRQKVILDELLGQRTAALNHMPGPQVGPQRAQDTKGSTPWCSSKRRSSTNLIAAPSSGGTSAGESTMRSSPWTGNTLPTRSGSRRNTGSSRPSAY